MRYILSVLTLLALLVSRASAHSLGAKETTLYVWAGDAARLKPDFLAVVNFDEASPDYGKVVRTVPLSGPGNIGNEPHHCHLSADGSVLACGGLLSVLRGQNDIFFFDVAQADDPKLIKSTRAPHASIIDDFYPLPGGGFLVTGMGSESGGAPGRLLEFDPSLNLVHEWPESPPTDGFNPHGIAVRPELNLMVTADFLNPITTIRETSGPVLRGSLRVWDLAKRQILRSIPLPAANGTMDVQLIPNDPQGRAYTSGMFDGWLYLADTAAGTVKPVFDYSTVTPGAAVPGGLPQMMRLTDGGRRMIVDQYGTGKLLLFDTSDPAAPKFLSALDLGPNAGPHDTVLTGDETRLVITDYFLNEDDFGVIHFDGDRQVHVVKVEPDKLTLDTRFQLDFNTAFPTGPARPHGIAMK